MNQSQTLRRGAALGLSALTAFGTLGLVATTWDGAVEVQQPDVALTATDALAPIVDSEIASMNGMFQLDTLLAGVSGDVIPASAANPFDVIDPTKVSTVQDNGTTLFDYLVYGVNPTVAGMATDPGAYSVLNGAMVPFDDGLNSLLHALLNNGGVLAWDSGDLFGGDSAMHIANTATTGWAEATDYFNFAMGDLLGYLGIFIPA